jgi:hypothetical protein
MAVDVATQPDVEAHVWAQLRPIGGVRSWVDGSTMDYPPWQCRFEFQVDARASDRVLARERAWQACYVMLGLPDITWDDGVITYVQPTVGPSWFPDSDGPPRYTARYEVRCHPAGLVPVAAAAGLSEMEGSS